MDISKYEKLFTQESRKYLTQLDEYLMKVEKDLGNRELWGDIHGKIHSVKGMARALSLDTITTLSHTMEGWCKLFQQGTAGASPRAVQTLFDGVNLLRQLVQHLGVLPEEIEEPYASLLSRFEKDPAQVPGEPTPADPSVSPALPKVEPIDYVRVRYALVEELLGISQEILLLEKSFPPLPEGTLSTGLKNWTGHYSSMLKGLYFRLAQLRLMSVGDFADLFAKTVRDLAREHRKEVRMEVVGGELEADIAILDRLREPFIHLVRNSLAHGLESPEERARGGKPREGVIRLEASSERGSLLLRVSDDGRGIDREAVREFLRSNKSMSDARIAAMPEESFFEAILSPEFSSSSRASDMSGRGIGMNVVTQAIQFLGGSMSIRSDPSWGTEFVIRLPVSLSIIYAITCRVGGYTVSIPTFQVDSIEKTVSGEFGHGDSSCDLRQVLGLPARGEGETVHILKLKPFGEPETGARREGDVRLAVDTILGNMPVMVLPVGELLSGYGLFSGVGVLENGDLATLLDTEYLVSSQRAEEGMTEVS